MHKQLGVIAYVGGGEYRLACAEEAGEAGYSIEEKGEIREVRGTGEIGRIVVSLGFLTLSKPRPRAKWRQGLVTHQGISRPNASSPSSYPPTHPYTPQTTRTG